MNEEDKWIFYKKDEIKSSVNYLNYCFNLLTFSIFPQIFMKLKRAIF